LNGCQLFFVHRAFFWFIERSFFVFLLFDSLLNFFPFLLLIIFICSFTHVFSLSLFHCRYVKRSVINPLDDVVVAVVAFDVAVAAVCEI